jgi:hypothetical protein
MTRPLSAALAVVLLSACAGGTGSPHTSAAATPMAPVPPTRDPGKDSLPLVAVVYAAASPHTFQGGDDHLSIGVDNRGRDIQDLVLLSPPWVAEHGLAMGSTRGCDPDLEAGTIHCGPVYAGQDFTAVLRAIPAHIGRFHYRVGLYDLEAGGLQAIAGPDGNPAVVEFDELVDPVNQQIPGYRPDPSPSPTVAGSSLG